jgi:anti-sigma regulatory factor (Ser/Thr protein kinase)
MRLLFDQTPDSAHALSQWLNAELSTDEALTKAIQPVATAEALHAICTSKQPDLLVADAHSYLQYRLQYPAPNCPVVWMTASPVSALLRLAIAHQVTTILPRQLPMQLQFWQMVIQGVYHGYLPASHLVANGGKHESWLVQNSNDILVGFHRLRHFFDAAGVRDLDDLSTVYMEAVTNGVYHALKTPEGHDRFVKGSHIEALPPEAWVQVMVWRDAEKAGIVVRDQGGSVQMTDALYWLDRHTRGAGQLDIHGRGFYLMRLLTDGFALTIQPGVSSELAAWQYHHPSAHPNKPLILLNNNINKDEPAQAPAVSWVKGKG